jgi:STE24 endopeptidase
VPLLLLVLFVLQLAAQPFQNLVSRRYEAEADWAALQTLRDPAAARGGLVKLGRSDLAEVQMPGLAYVMLATHPTIEERLGMVEAWRRSQRAR